MNQLQTVNSEGADVFDGIARVLNGIQRLKSSEGGGTRGHRRNEDEGIVDLMNTTFDGTSQAFPPASEAFNATDAKKVHGAGWV